MVYVPLATGLLLNPGAVAIACKSVVAVIVTVVHTGEPAVGVVPSVVQCMVDAGVVSESVTTTVLV